MPIIDISAQLLPVRPCALCFTYDNLSLHYYHMRQTLLLSVMCMPCVFSSYCQYSVNRQQSLAIESLERLSYNTSWKHSLGTLRLSALVCACCKPSLQRKKNKRERKYVVWNHVNLYVHPQIKEG